MQVAAANPAYVAREDVPGDVLEKEREIYREQMADQKKPAQVIDKIVEGKLEKFFTREVPARAAVHQGRHGQDQGEGPGGPGDGQDRRAHRREALRPLPGRRGRS